MWPTENRQRTQGEEVNPSMSMSFNFSVISVTQTHTHTLMLLSMHTSVQDEMRSNA